MPAERKQALIRAFAHALRNERDYIFGPDMGTDEECMAWVKDEIGRAVGLPAVIGGIPLDEIGATGLGLKASVEAAMKYCDFKLSGARVAVQGFGSVGKHAARFLGEKGTVLVAACQATVAMSASGTLHNEVFATTTVTETGCPPISILTRRQPGSAAATRTATGR